MRRCAAAVAPILSDNRLACNYESLTKAMKVTEEEVGAR